MIKLCAVVTSWVGQPRVILFGASLPASRRVHHDDEFYYLDYADPGAGCMAGGPCHDGLPLSDAIMNRHEDLQQVKLFNSSSYS